MESAQRTPERFDVSEPFKARLLKQDVNFNGTQRGGLAHPPEMRKVREYADGVMREIVTDACETLYRSHTQAEQAIVI